MLGYPILFYNFVAIYESHRYAMKYILAFILSFISYWVYAQNIAVTDIPTLDQLPVSAIHRVFRDSEGYMWYGTVNGLCRDDGYHVKVFRSDIETPGLLDDNLIESITEDKEGRIWFGTDKGAYILDKSDYSVRALDEERLKGIPIMNVYATSDGYIWVSYHAVLARYDVNGQLIKEYLIRNENGNSSVSGFCESRNQDLIIAVWNGRLYHWDRQKDEFVPYPDKMRRHNLTVMVQDKDHDYFWLATWGDGVVRFDPSAPEDSMYLYSDIPVNAAGEQDGLVLSVAQDDKLGYLWITTGHDFMAFEQQADGKLKQLKFPNGLLPVNHMLVEVLKGEGCLWVSAFDRPSFIVHLMDNMTKDYALPALYDRVNRHPAIMALCDDGDDILWLMQERTGLVLYDLKGDKMSVYTDFPELRSLPLDAGREMTRTHINKGVWIARDLNRLVYNVSRQGMEMHLEDAIDLNGKVEQTAFVTKLYEDSRGNLWIGLSKGLCIYDVKARKITQVYDRTGHVTGIVENRDGLVWICTKDSGLYRGMPDGELQSIEINKDFSSLSIAPDGLLWLGTGGGGVYAYDPSEGKMTDFNQACGMNGDQVNQIVADAYNHIWIDTNQKLIEFNPRNGSFRTYLTTDGSILLRRFLPTAVCQGMDGNIYFGGIPGICRVTPSNGLERKGSVVKTRITDIKLQEESLIFGSEKGNNSVHHIELRPDDQNLEISFSSLNHRYASKIRYAYRLKGVDKGWVYVEGGKNSAFYNHLNKGSYIFQVKATDENGLWSKEVTELVIHRLPAFYETWWAYLFYLLVVMGVSGYSLFLYLKRVERKNNEMWADSSEMMKMRTYLDSEVNLPEPEFMQLDKLLLEKAVKAVEDNLTEPDFDVTALADAMNMSRSTLTRKLKVITGRTPLDFIRNIKMKHARHMLEDKDKSVTEVAATLGYFNRKYFTTCFKEEFGMTPSEFQKSVAPPHPDADRQ